MFMTLEDETGRTLRPAAMAIEATFAFGNRMAAHCRGAAVWMSEGHDERMTPHGRLLPDAVGP
jgi:hypothetical protein